MDWKERKLAGVKGITDIMYAVLELLYNADERDEPFEILYDMHHATRDALLRHRWIYASHGLDGVRYCITLLGRDIYLKYRGTPPRRTDGICPRCLRRPRHVYPGGGVASHCLPCKQTIERKTLALGRRRNSPDSPCSRCKQAPRYISKNGSVSQYCAPCKTAIFTAYQAKRRKALLERIRAGEVLLCTRCKKRPFYVSGNTVFQYCQECYNQMARERKRKRVRHSSRSVKSVKSVKDQGEI